MGKELVETAKHIAIVFACFFFLSYSFQWEIVYSRKLIFTFAVFYGLVSFSARIVWKKYLKYHPRKGNIRSLFVITTADQAENIITNVKSKYIEIIRIVGIAIVDKDMRGEKIANIPVAAGASDVIEHLKQSWVDEVFVNIPQGMEYQRKIVEYLLEMGIVTHLNLSEYEVFSKQKQYVERMGKFTVLTTCLNDMSLLQVFIKRVIDIAGGVIGCLITLILAFILGPVIYLKSPGPIFFSQIRVGKNGKRFKMYKFRSMYLDAEKRKNDLMENNRVKDGYMFKLDWDPRIIGTRKLPDGSVKKGIGNFIRDYSLDEFPQFFNVLKGDMSLIGTRPPTIDEWEKYEMHHRARLSVKPGITGMWQVSGRSDITDFEQVVELDRRYILEWNIWLDIKILIKTIVIVFKKNGAM